MGEKRQKRALVLSGGGARGAYEAGVLKYILQELPDHLGHRPRLDILCGTSVGAINAVWMAAMMHRPERCVERMEELWRGLVFSETVQFSYRELWRNFRRTFVDPRVRRVRRWTPGVREESSNREGGFLRTTTFDGLIRQEIPFWKIEENMKSGLLESVSVTATEVVTGRRALFVQSAVEMPAWSRDPRRVAIPGPLTADKVLASAAIPLLFPTVRIGDHWYCDGGLRQNTPISPALRLGAEKVLIVSLRRRSMEERIGPNIANPPREKEHPNQAFVVGKLLDALLLDPLDYDLEVMERFNAILEHGEEAFGERFVDQLNEVVRAHRGQGYRQVGSLLIRPSQDIGQMASQFARQKNDEFWGAYPIRAISQRALEDEGARESDLLSYLLFDGEFAGQLLEMGYRDARARHDPLLEFFSD